MVILQKAMEKGDGERKSKSVFLTSFLLWNDLLIGCMEKVQTLFFGAPKSLQMVIAAIKLKDAYSLEGKLWPT